MFGGPLGSNVMNNPTPSPQDAAAALTVAEAAVVLSGGHLHPFTRDLIEQMGRGEISGDQAAAAVIGEFVGTARPQ